MNLKITFYFNGFFLYADSSAEKISFPEVVHFIKSAFPSNAKSQRNNFSLFKKSETWTTPSYRSGASWEVSAFVSQICLPSSLGSPCPDNDIISYISCNFKFFYNSSPVCRNGRLLVIFLLNSYKLSFLSSCLNLATSICLLL